MSKLTGIEVKTISGIDDIEWYLNQTPGEITEDHRAKIEASQMWLDVILDHDKQTASWSFEESNNSHTSVEDDYNGCVDFFEEEEKEEVEKPKPKPKKEDYAIYDGNENMVGYWVSDNVLDNLNGGNPHTEESRKAFCQTIGAKKLVFTHNPMVAWGEYEIIFAEEEPKGYKSLVDMYNKRQESYKENHEK